MSSYAQRTRQRKMLRVGMTSAAALVGVFVTSILVMASTWPTINRVEAGKSIEYPELRPKTYQLGYDRVYDEALSSAKEQENWAVLGEDRDTGTIQAEASMPVTGWMQKIEIRVAKRGTFVSRVYIASEGDDAPGDLGQNARNIEAYYGALDQRLGAAQVQ